MLVSSKYTVFSQRATAFLLILGALVCFGCSDRDYVRTDDYEKMSEPDYTLRQLMGVQTLRTHFEMPEAMRSFRIGLILIADGTVVGSSPWYSGDGLHGVHSGGAREYEATTAATVGGSTPNDARSISPTLAIGADIN